jgi:hypothetical protein
VFVLVVVWLVRWSVEWLVAFGANKFKFNFLFIGTDGGSNTWPYLGLTGNASDIMPCNNFS